MKIFLLLIFASLTAGVKVESFISGGNEANPNQFPFAVVVFGIPIGTIRTRSCGGALLSRNAVLTAAFCVYEREEIEVGLGVHNIADQTEPFQVWMPIYETRIHPNYPADPTSDIAMIRLPHPIGFFNQAVQIISLPPDEQFLGTTGAVMGWGCPNAIPNPTMCTPTNILRHVLISTQPDTACNANEAQMCAQGGPFAGSICPNDEGGPFFTSIQGTRVLLGIVQGPLNPCQNVMRFARVTHFLPWIRENM